MKPRSHVCALAALLAGASAPLFAQILTYNNGGATGVWSTPSNWTGSTVYPDAAGVLALRSATAVPGVALDVNATVGGVRNTTGSASVWTLTNAGGFTLTLDGTGLTNGFGNANTSEIRATSSGGIVCAANLLLSNTNLDIGTTGSNNAAAQVTLSGAIAAATNQTITIRNNRRQTNLQGDIGTTGAGEITIVNASNSGTAITDPNQLTISGNLGPKVVQLIQGAGVTSGMVISGANAAFTGDVTVLARSITVGSTGTLGNSNTVLVANGANLVLQNAAALGSGSTLVLEDSGTTALDYSGTMTIDALSLNGGTLYVAGGSIWGSSASGAPNVSAQLTGTGLLQVAVPTSDPDIDDDGLDDAWEIFYFGNTTVQNGSGDPDGDSFTNAQEQTAGSNPTVTASTPNDIDGDGLADAWEVTNFGNRTSQSGSGDPDGDGATNLQEQAAGTNPLNAGSWPDTDGDGLKDAWETVHFGNLTAATGSGDADNDGASNLAEMTAGSDPHNASWTPTRAVLAHRWSFNGDLLDSIGTSHATIVDPDGNPAVGGNVTQGASEITLAGGASASSAAVRLGSNLVGGRATPVTIELWATSTAVMNWGRIFDFGSSTTEYLFMSWTQGTNQAQDQVEWVDAGVTNRGSNTNAPYTLGEKYHIVLTLTPATYTNGALASGTRVRWYTATAATTTGLVAKGTFDTANTLASLNDLDDWIGRSMWAGDSVAAASYDEVRIWDGALTNDEVNTYQLAGPTAFATLSGLQSWRQAYFGSPDNSGSGADASDADQDGIANLIEYATGTVPTTADLSAPATVTRGGNFLGLIFNHIGDPALHYAVEASSDLVTWTEVGTYTGFSAGGTTTYTDNVDLTTAGVRRFLRLKITP